MVAVQKFKFLRESIIDVVTFEIKPQGECNVKGVAEAIAHRQRAYRSYVIFHISDENFGSEVEKDRVMSLAAQNGIGIILADKPHDYETWVTKLSAKRWLPEPQDLNQFIEDIFDKSDHNDIIKLTR